MVVHVLAAQSIQYMFCLVQVTSVVSYLQLTRQSFRTGFWRTITAKLALLLFSVGNVKCAHQAGFIMILVWFSLQFLICAIQHVLSFNRVREDKAVYNEGASKTLLFRAHHIFVNFQQNQNLAKKIAQFSALHLMMPCQMQAKNVWFN